MQTRYKYNVYMSEIFIFIVLKQNTMYWEVSNMYRTHMEMISNGMVWEMPGVRILDIFV